MANESRMTEGETQLAGFFAKYEPAMAKLGKALRKKLRARLPGLSEVVYVYESQESLVISYSPTGQGYDAVCTLALYPLTAKLYFAYGPQLSKADTNRLLQGTAAKVRFVEVAKDADFDRPEIEALIAAVVKQANVRLDASAKGSLIIKAEEQKQRARRATKAVQPAVQPAKTPAKTKAKTPAKKKSSR